MTLLELLDLLKHHLKLVVFLPIFFALAVGAYAYLFMANTYTASVSMYVLTPLAGDNNSLNTELSASQLLANDVATLIQSERVTADAAHSLGLDSLDGFNISVTSETTTRVITCSVTGTDPRAAADVANAIAASVSDVAQEVMDVQSVNVIDEAAVPAAPSGPNRPLYVAVGLMAGLFAAVAIVVLRDMLDTRVRPDELQDLLGVPVIGRIPLIKEGK
ncbi:Wzz/FepE/Etk N-terminal domain-containing protein [Collinsella sp. An2]|uniref:YveK family protein n=1 Tax=Collinsella sp. An2 TaxID=1965585 RepID=UPI000B39AAB9|nr:Wzz/FepE/Etk N-terminal domain-containing protein [Collinsella sp. An2]OUP08459.1 lipopolysaccharide biosynthesis protein [Collinsella sp. An2]